MTAYTPLSRRTRQHRSGNSYSVRLPREMAYADPAQELEIEMSGETLTIRPLRPTFAEMFEAMKRDGGEGLPPESGIRPLGPRNPWDKR